MAELRTLGLSGFDRAEEAEFRALFEKAGLRGWVLATEHEAAALLIDFDSMYGQMAWLKAQGSGRPIAAFTAAIRADTDFMLRRPLTVESLETLLREMEAAVRPRHVSGTMPAIKQVEAAAPRPQPTPPPPSAPAAVPAAAAAAAVPPKPAEAAARVPRRLIDFLDPGVLPGPVRLIGSQPALAFDPHAFTYAGGQSLKPLATFCSRDIGATEWQSLTPEQYAALKTELGTQPLTRLRWLAGLCAWGGQLCPELLDASAFKLVKWPQSEREFPKHFKIATTLLKQSGSLDELATASGATREDVADFINACHAIGMIEAEGASPAATVPDPQRGGLMNRLRGR